MTAITAELPPRSATRSFGGPSLLPGFPERGPLAPSRTHHAFGSAMALRGWLVQSLLLEAVMRSEADGHAG